MPNSYYWQKSMHINMGKSSITLWNCPELGICKQANSKKVKGLWQQENIYFFAAENGEGDPVYTLKEILVEAEYRKSLRERDLIEVGGEQ